MKFKKITLNEQERDVLKKKLLNRSKLNESNKCLEWVFGMGPRGYGSVFFKKHSLLTHRASWIAFKGDIPDGYLVCHKCDNPICINIDHLFLGTHSENMDDMISKGRWRGGKGGKRRAINTERTQMAFDINPETKQLVKIQAAKRNISMNLWIQRAIIEKLEKEKKYE